MNKRFSFRLILAVFLFAIFLSRAAFAEDPRFVSTYHTEYGLKLINDEKFDLAIERFTKAFLLDPQNKTAKESMQKLVSDHAISNAKGMKILRLIDQVEYLDFLMTRYQSLIAENTRLIEYLQNNQALLAEKTLFETFQDLEKKASGKPSKLPIVGSIGFSGDDSRTVNIDELVSKLSRERQELNEEVRIWEFQNEQLRSIRKTLLSRKSSDHSLTAVNKFKSQFEELNQRVADKDQLLAVQQQNIEYFQTELTAVRQSFTSLQEKFKETDGKILDLTNRIASMSVELFEKNKIIGEKEERAANLEKELEIAYEKMGLGQKIIQEKDDQIRDRVVNLEFQYADLTTKYQNLQNELQLKESQVARLTEVVSKKENLAKEYRAAFFATDAKANELIGMVEIYRGKLVETKKSLMAKEDELRQLKKVLFQVNSPSATLPHPNLEISQNREFE